MSSKIENILKLQNGREQTKKAALVVKSNIEAGASIDSQKSDGISVEIVNALGRRDNAKVSDPSIVHHAFEILPDQDEKPSLKVVDLSTGDVALMVLNKVNLPENLAEDKLSLVKNEALRENAIRDFSNVLQSLKDNADIDKNLRVLEK